MKICMTEDSKKCITVDKMPIIKQLQTDFKTENFKSEAMWAAEIANNKAYGTNWTILKIEAEFALNSRIWNWYNDNSENVDIWLTVYAFHDFEGLIIAGVSLSDLWQYDSSDESANAIRNHMFIRKFTQK